MGNVGLLPVGTVVYLKGAKRKIVIIGFGAVEEGSTVVWDYLGAPYPIGVISSDKNLLFNIDQIERVVFIGYIDDEDKELRKEILDKLESLR